MRILAIDNYDSFVHILADELRRRAGEVDVYRSHWPISSALQYIRRRRPDLVVFSPGPGRPEDAGLCLELLAAIPEELPVLGVCLGHQCIIHHFGGRVGRSDEIVHGKPALIRHTGDGLFKDLENPMQVGRYHSLIGLEMPESLVVDAECDGKVMAVHHRDRPIWGVQFHPESILTPSGGRLIENLLGILEDRHAAKA